MFVNKKSYPVMNNFQTAIFAIVFTAPLVTLYPLYRKQVRLEKGDFSKNLLKATSFAAVKHSKQVRKNTMKSPYIEHPIRVAELVATLGNSAARIDMLQAALLHDTVEDTDTTFSELESIFGPRVKNLVHELTDDKSLPKEVRKKMQIDNASKKSREAKIISLCDKIANLEDLLLRPNGQGIPEGWSVERVQNYCAWALKVSQGLKGENQALDDRLFELVNGTFHYIDGNVYSALPRDIDNASLV